MKPALGVGSSRRLHEPLTKLKDQTGFSAAMNPFSKAEPIFQGKNWVKGGRSKKFSNSFVFGVHGRRLAVYSRLSRRMQLR